MKLSLRILAATAALATCVAVPAATRNPAALAQPTPTADIDHGPFVPAPKELQVRLATRPAPGGVLVHALTRKYRWAPEHLSPIHGLGKVVIGEGHGHIYVDGAKAPALMIVGLWTYVPLKPGRHTLRVTPNANNHFEYGRNGKPIQATIKARA